MVCAVITNNVPRVTTSPDVIEAGGRGPVLSSEGGDERVGESDVPHTSYPVSSTRHRLEGVGVGCDPPHRFLVSPQFSFLDESVWERKCVHYLKLGTDCKLYLSNSHA